MNLHRGAGWRFHQVVSGILRRAVWSLWALAVSPTVFATLPWQAVKERMEADRARRLFTGDP